MLVFGLLANCARHEPESVAALRTPGPGQVRQADAAARARTSTSPRSAANRPDPPARRAAPADRVDQAGSRRPPTCGGAAQGGRSAPETGGAALARIRPWTDVSCAGPPLKEDGVDRLLRVSRNLPLDGSPQTGWPRPAVVVVAGGGTAGHIEPALALADAVMRLRPDARVVALGTARGLETHHRAGPRLPAGADPAGADAPQALARPAQAAAARCATRSRQTGPCWTVSARTWSSASAATSRCRPTWPPAATGADRRARGQRPRRPGQQGRRQVRREGRRRRAGFRPAGRPGDRHPAAALDHLHGPRRVARAGPRSSSGSTRTPRRCWSPAARRAPSR